MSHDLKRVILQLDKKNNPEVNKEQAKKVADKMYGSSNLVIKAAGALGQSAVDDLDLAIVRKADAEVENSNSTTHLHDMNNSTVDVYADMAKTLTDELGADDAEIQTYLVELSKATTTDGTKPAKAHGGSAVQSEIVGKALMHFAPIKGATYYKIWFSTNPDSSIMSAYSRTEPDTFPNSHGGLVNVLTGIKIWFRIQACNAHGDGIMSDAFGGISFSATL